jgi:hypothetical protein
LAGYIWLFLNFKTNNSNEIGICIFKHVTTIPCPSCGSTRSILSLMHGQFLEAIYWNPIGLLLVIIIIASPIWIIFDFAFKKNTLFLFYKKIETILSQKRIAIPAILLILTNWIWNIYKGL